MRKQKIIIIAAAVVLLAVIVGYYFYNEKNRKEFLLEEHLDETVFTVNETEITLKEVMYYIMDIEAYTNQQAIIYNPNDPTEYWSRHLSAGDDSAYIHAIAKEQVYEVCIVDYLYILEAEENTFSLSDKAVDTANEEALELYNSMTDKQKSSAGFELEDIEAMKQKEMLATAYAEFLANNTDWTDTVVSPATEMSYNGEFFQENILSKYKISINKDLWEEIQLGKLTIN